MQGKIDIHALWAKVVDKIKMQIMQRTLWQSLEISAPVVIDGNVFVVGFGPGNFHLSGFLTSPEHKNAIETALRELTGVSLTLRVIDGITIQDWMNVKQKDASMQEMREDARVKRERASAVSKSWDTLLEQVARSYARTPLRQLPQARATYIQEMIVAISETMDVLMPKGAPLDELAERSLARAIDKIGQLAEVSPTIVALEIARYRDKR